MELIMDPAQGWVDNTRHLGTLGMLPLHRQHHIHADAFLRREPTLLGESGAQV
jgi:hypothetical protein